MGRQAGIIALGLLATTLAARAEAACSVAITGELKFELVDGSPVMSGVIEGKPVRFGLALGSRFNEITDEAVARLDLNAQSEEGVTAYSSGRPISLRSVRTPLDLGGAQVREGLFLVNPNRSDRLDGVIGDLMFDRFDIELDPTKSVLRLVTASDCKDEPLVYWEGATAVAPLGVWQEGMTTEVKVNGRTLTAKLAPQIPVSLLSLEAGRLLGFGPESPGVEAAPPYREGANPTWFVRVQSFAIGEEVIQSTRLRLGNVNAGRARDIPTGSRTSLPVTEPYQMILGADFFASHRVLFAKGQKRLYLTYLGGGVFRRPTAAVPPAAVGGLTP